MPPMQRASFVGMGALGGFAGTPPLFNDLALLSPCSSVVSPLISPL